MRLENSRHVSVQMRLDAWKMLGKVRRARRIGDDGIARRIPHVPILSLKGAWLLEVPAQAESVLDTWRSPLTDPPAGNNGLERLSFATSLLGGANLSERIIEKQVIDDFQRTGNVERQVDETWTGEEKSRE